ncbi:MAG: methyl-accepting chemotaxis protein [Candidatus Acidiferrales bacterium]
MSWFSDKKLGTKLILSFSMVLALTAVLGVFSLMKLAAVRATTVDMAENWMVAIRSLEDMRFDLASARRYQLRGALAKTAEDRDAQIQNADASIEDFKKAAATYTPTITGPEERKLADDATTAFEEYVQGSNEIKQLARQGKAAEADQLMLGPQKAVFDKTAAAIQKDVEFNVQGATKANALSTDIYTSARWWAAGLLIVCVVLGLLLATWIARLISRPVQEVAEVAKRIAAGDLTGREIPVQSRDEVGALSESINAMQRNLRETISSVSASAERIATASEEFSATAAEQASGAESQKDQTHQVATAMQEMSSTVQQVSENSNKAAEASRNAADTARKGGSIVEDTLLKMRAIADSVGQTAKKVQELGKSSNQIGEIIGVIDDIADQTNLLALNAAIEAARAGEQGRGFAVVADEVRKLAERTSKATKEITQMIQNIQTETQSAVEAMQSGTKQVELGVESTTKAGTSLHEIITTSEQVGNMVMLIATAATEQASATDEINSNIEQIAKITQETATGANESAKAVHELSNLATELHAIVSKFKIDGNRSGSRRTSTQNRRPRAASLREEVSEHELVEV